jgi:DNA-binding response OmpR family regulator
VQALGDYRCVIALSGFEAICCLNAHVFDAYVLDYWLPDWSGISLCREIRKADPHGPIVFYGSRDGKEQRKRIVRAGANASLGPLELNAVREQLYTLLDHARLDSLAACTAAQDALQQELERRAAAAAGRPDRAQHMTARAVERTAKIRAYTAFVETGGTRADFERWWPQTLRCALAGRNASQTW